MRSSSSSHLMDIRAAALRGGPVGYSAHDERFNRLARTLKRVLQVPIAVITVVEDERQWIKAAQGLDASHPLRGVAQFCAHVVTTGLPVIVSDTLASAAFADNPLVTGPPGVRSWVGWPVESAPGLPGGAICGLDTMPRQYSEDEIGGLKDLARIAECELHAHATATLQKSLLQRLDLVQRRHALDPFTGCWSIRGFRELLGVAVPQAQADGSHLALCHLRVDVDAAMPAMGELERTSVLSVLAQQLRERLPADGALARLGQTDFCALVPAPGARVLEHLLEPVSAPEISAVLPDGRRLAATIESRVVRLADLGRDASASKLWAAVLADTQAAG